VTSHPDVRDVGVAGDFDYALRRLGLRAARTELVPSHFDHKKQALLYVPQNLPDPRSPAFGAAAAKEIVEILTLSRGRAFVLFTSYQQMRLIYDRVSLEVHRRCCRAPARATHCWKNFAPRPTPFVRVLFWQGVDVPGAQPVRCYPINCRSRYQRSRGGSQDCRSRTLSGDAQRLPGSAGHRAEAGICRIRNRSIAACSAGSPVFEDAVWADLLRQPPNTRYTTKREEVEKFLNMFEVTVDQTFAAATRSELQGGCENVHGAQFQGAGSVGSGSWLTPDCWWFSST
jgi:hypothetical protein